MSSLATREQSALFGERRKAVKVLARSIFRELRENGYTPNQIVNLSSELIGLITTEIAAVGTNFCGP